MEQLVTSIIFFQMKLLQVLLADYVKNDFI